MLSSNYLQQLAGCSMIRPGKVTCAGLVAIMMLLPTSIWKSSPIGASASASVRRSVEFRKVTPRIIETERATDR